jgi:hypothetical protein
MLARWLKIALVALVMLTLVAGGTDVARAQSAADAPPVSGEVYWFNGPITHWPAAWTPIPDLDDPADGADPEADFVGNPASPGAYFAADQNYIYFRVRLKVGEVAAPIFPLTSQDADLPAGWSDRTFRDQILIVLDNTADGMPDWGIGWDINDWPYFHGGLKLLYRDANSPATGQLWGQLRDADGAEDAKIAPPDFRWNSTDGYVRTIDRQETADFGPTTFVDFALSWEFLARQRNLGLPLLPGQTWRVQFVSMAGQPEEGAPSIDTAGAATLADGAIANWGAVIAATPPPAATSAPPPTANATLPATPAVKATAAPTATSPATQLGGWQRARFVDFLDFRHPSGWTVTGRGDTNVLRGSYKGHDYLIDVFRPERPTGTSLEGWVEAELKRFRADPDAVAVRNLAFARVPATRVALLDLPGGDDCPVVRIYVWSEDPPIPDIRQAMITISQADRQACDPNALGTFVDMLIVMANK